MQNIFKILDFTVFEEAQVLGRFSGAAIDLKDGYIHFSTAEQVKATAQLHFHGQKNLVLLAVSQERLGDALKWEASRGGQLFPHLYAALDMSDVLWAKAIPWNGEAHDFPPEIFQ